MIDAETFIEDSYSVWKVFAFLYLLILCAFFLDVSNASFLFSPAHFSFVPALLFVGAIKFPKLMVYGVAFFFGVLTDLLSYTPIGLMGGLYLFTVVHKLNEDFFNPAVSCAVSMHHEVAELF
ncbi:MAG: hypothetical protein ACPG05_03980, partial [Bdellovibrionales bacterium]